MAVLGGGGIGVFASVREGCHQKRQRLTDDAHPKRLGVLATRDRFSVSYRARCTVRGRLR